MRGLRAIINHLRHAKGNLVLVVGVLVFGAVAFSVIGALGQGSAQAASPNDIVYGGIYNRADLAAKCTGDVKTIMDHYRIDCNLTGVVDGRACKDNKVYVGDKVVAYNSQSIGRQQKPGDHAISIGGQTYWEAPNSVAFLQECIDTFVKLDQNGSFVYAILKPCGNPIWTPNPVVVTPPPVTTPPPAKPQTSYIKVCEIATKKILTIRQEDYNASIHSMNLADCQIKYLKVCELATKKILTINEEEFNSSLHSKNLADCQEAVKTIQVCVLATKTITTINEKDFDATKYSKTVADCQETACVENPKAGVYCGELPKTGITDNLVGAGFGLGSVIVAGSAYAASRKDLLSTLLNL